MTQNESNPQAGSSDPIVANPGRYYRNTRYILCLAFIAFGAWFAYDGWYGWPKGNERFDRLTSELEAARAVTPPDEAKIKSISDELSGLKRRTDSDLRLQKRLAVICPLAGLAMLGWALYRSRGTYWMSGDEIRVPGHPPIRIGDITQIDKRLWDRKGIAHLDYKLPDGTTGRFTLDDFLYERKPTDAIYERILKAVAPDAGTAASAADAGEKA
jgi:hypothetical protein